MNRKERAAIAALLPKHAYDKTPQGDHINATWTTSRGHYTLKTSKWDRDMDWTTRVEMTNAEGESITLKTENVDRVREAMVLLGCGPEEGQ